MIKSETQVRRNEQVLTRQGEQELLLLCVDNGRYYTLDEVGSRVWQLCDGTRTVAGVSACIAEEFDAPAEDITADVRELLTELLREQLVCEGR